MIEEISIIIPTLNEEHYLPTTLEAIAKQNFYGKLEVIVVDGGSKDKTIEKARKFKSKIKELKIITIPKGIGLARNRGADIAKYKYLLFIDSDIIFPSNFLNTLLKKIKPDGDFVDFILHKPTKPDLGDYLWIAAIFGFISISRLWDPICSGTFLFTTKSNHKKVKGFDEGIIMGEDIDYGRRSRALGAKYHLHYNPQVLASPRRLREIGRVRLFWWWTKGYFHVLRHGPMYKNDIFPYPFGEHKKID
ncbi:MAG: glycosyltransferase [bacterium]|nr:glycosyltransferase [bacterium]